MISETKASKLLNSYFNLLTQTGYVKRKTVSRFLMYMFLIDMVLYMHAFITENDYKKIDAFLSRLFATGGCLFSYPVFCDRRITLCTERATLGQTDPMSDYSYRVRITEGVQPRSSEDEDLRITEQL